MALHCKECGSEIYKPCFFSELTYFALIYCGLIIIATFGYYAGELGAFVAMVLMVFLYVLARVLEVVFIKPRIKKV